MGLSPETSYANLEHRLNDTKTGDIVETCPAATAVISEIGHRIENNGGAALIIDYGDWRSLGDTFQALKSQQYYDPFSHPGEADLTAHVDFDALATTTPSAYSRVTPQGVFLERLGITQRAQALANGMSDQELAKHVAAHRRLTHPEEMGNLFKVMALFPKGQNPPPGLEI